LETRGRGAASGDSLTHAVGQVSRERGGTDWRTHTCAATGWAAGKATAKLTSQIPLHSGTEADLLAGEAKEGPGAAMPAILLHPTVTTTSFPYYLGRAVSLPAPHSPFSPEIE